MTDACKRPAYYADDCVPRYVRETVEAWRGLGAPEVVRLERLDGSVRRIRELSERVGARLSGRAKAGMTVTGPSEASGDPDPASDER